MYRKIDFEFFVYFQNSTGCYNELITSNISGYGSGDKRDNKTTNTPEQIANMERKKSELETKLLILYAICSLELVIILCFVGLLILGKYQDWRLMQKYNKAKSPHVLEKFQTNISNEYPGNNGKGYISISELIPYKY